MPAAERLGRVHREQLAFADGATSFDEVRAVVRRMETAKRALEVHRGSDPRASLVDFTRLVISALEPPLA